MLVVVAATGMSGGARIVTFAGGSTTIDPESGVDHVVVRDEKGNVTSESRCDLGTFDDYFSLFTKLRDAVSRPDRQAVVNLVAYPFRVNGKKPVVFRSPASLATRYESVFTDQVRAKIARAEPAAVFCRGGQAMLGDGVVWARRTGLAVLNP
jgi:hypothetical protein